MQYSSILTHDGNKKKIKTKSSKAYPHIYFTLVSGALCHFHTNNGAYHNNTITIIRVKTL
jgi:hypothetical protein